MGSYERAIVHSGDSAFTERCALVARNSPHSPLVTRRMPGVLTRRRELSLLERVRNTTRMRQAATTRGEGAGRGGGGGGGEENPQ